MITHFLGRAGAEDVKHPGFEKGSILEKAIENRKKDIHSEKCQDIKRIKIIRVVGFRFGTSSAEATLTPRCGLEIFQPHFCYNGA
jgi:hypothetical protein